MIIILRYRDLTVPEGATIERHREIIAREDVVMWGWMMRQSEAVPTSLLTQLAREHQSTEFYLYDSGSCEIRRATLIGLSVFPDGIRIPTPVPRQTPTYMAEALCPVWFHFSDISDEATNDAHLILEGYPTLPKPKRSDIEKLSQVIRWEELRETGATLWTVSRLPEHK